MANSDEKGSDLASHAEHMFDEALDNAWGAATDSSGMLKAEFTILSTVLPAIRALSIHRQNYLKTQGII